MIFKNPNTLTLEQTARVLEKFRIAFTVEGVKSKIHQQQLTTVPKPKEDRRFSAYPYLITNSSIVDYLRKKGFIDETIKNALPYDLEI